MLQELHEQEPQRRAISFDYNLSWDPGEELYTLASDQYVRNSQGTLLVKPRNMEDMPMQTLSLSYTLTTGSQDSSATHLDGTLVWRDLDSDASVTATLESRTLSPFAVSSLSSVDGALRVDLLDQENLAALSLRLRQSAQQQFQALLTKLATSVYSFAAPVR